MKKIFIALVFAVSAIGAANAQRKVTVSGVVADADTHKGMVGAVVIFSPEGDSTAMSSFVTGAGGAFSIGLTAGRHDMSSSMFGYSSSRQRIEVGDQRMTLDTVFLRQGIEIDAVTTTAVALRTSLSGDTLIYNADSYKVADDASVAGLLEKMPGIKVEGGTVEAQGEAVRKVLIDNREFFGEDVAAAISALPAEAVKNIEVFDKLSDNAEFTGIDDGEGYKAINIVTRESMRQGIMGQVSGAYGVEPSDEPGAQTRHYGMLNGNVNIFQGDAKYTIRGTLNNLNERSFNIDDMLGVGDNNGFGKVGNIQINYIDVLGKKDQWKVEGGYGYNVTDSENDNTVDREYFQDEDAIYRNFFSDQSRNSFSQNHNINARIDFEPNENHELRIRPSVRFQGNHNDRNGYEIYYPADLSTKDVLLDNWSNNRGTGWNTGLNLNYRVRLGKPGRTVSLFFNGNYNSNEQKGESYSERQEKEDDGSQVFRRLYSPSFNYGYNLSGGVTYTEPLGGSSLINLDYSVRYNYSDQDRKSYLWDALMSGYDMSTFDPELSGIYNSGYLVHRVGPGYRMQKDGITLSAGVFYQYSTLESNREMPVSEQPRTEADFNNITYSLMVDSKLGEGGSSLRVFLNSNTRNPGVNDLQDIVDISNVQNIRKGDPNLKPSYGNMLYTRLIIPDLIHGRTLSFNLGGSYTVNSIAQRTVSESPGYEVMDSSGNVVETLDAVGRYSEPINMDGAWSANLGVDYGFPISFLKSNLNIGGNVGYNESPSQMGHWAAGNPDTNGDGVGDVIWTSNYSRNMNAGGSITLGSNISEKVDFRIRYSPSYNNVRNTFSGNSNSEYMRHTASADFKFVLPADFTLAGNVMYSNYNSMSGQSFNQEYVIANASVGLKVFRNKRGEISLFVNDIFNQNVSFNRRAYAQYIQNETNSIIGRYFGVRFAWNIRKFGKNGSQNIEMYDTGGDQFNRGGGFMGPPGGGGGRPF